jgi:hypothetical protein
MPAPPVGSDAAKLSTSGGVGLGEKIGGMASLL